MQPEMETEWNDWQEVMKSLREAGAYTDEDATVSADEAARNRDTPGKKIVGAIRQWGKSEVLRAEASGRR